MKETIADAYANLAHFPEAAADAPDGKYVIRMDETGEVGSFGPKIEYSNWFKTPPLDEQTIERLHGLQLVTRSRDQGFCDDKAAGIWTWFEVAIMANSEAESPRVKGGIELVWTTHKNVQGKDEFLWRKSKVFPKNHDIFRLIEPNNVLVIRLCSRFYNWSITADTGILVLELGEPVKRKSLGNKYRDIKTNLLTTQEALNQVNEALFPDRKDIAIPTLPKSIYRAENLSTATEEKRPLRVLSLDGGGVRGISSLMVLKKVMEEAFPEEKGKKPCEVFDIIGGTSTGGLIAIMLGCLEMDVDECLETYNEYMNEIFPSPGKAAAGLAMRDAGVLERKIKELIGKKLGVKDPENVLLYDRFKDDPKCKVFVTAVKTEGVSNNAPVLLRSYQTDYEMPAVPGIKLWEAARATSAAPVYFDPLTVSYLVGQEERKVTFVDGGLQANNPVGWQVIQRFSPVRPTSCFLSIGTGRGLGVSLPSFSALQSLSFAGGMTSILTNTESANVLFRVLINMLSPITSDRKYWRFDCGDGLPDFFVDEKGVGTWRLLANLDEHDLGQMDDVEMVPFMRKLTEKYMDQAGFKQLSKDTAEALNPKEKEKEKK
ncbi:acyl transferase/acyl hydrolase/lysophospholipase [Plectosphaerella plurivora]|uniref:Acyl transferase/acyl hydrolase/lysophospholipase n=1 Tax=Plectosphaerella plurivora TaxID=936078 RepID=A0A9P8V9F8_9PEZI|nr:acyl transferase/acyl hydrolase/lysophospholipase [Plectosphaerella plurivora]